MKGGLNMAEVLWSFTGAVLAMALLVVVLRDGRNSDGMDR